MALRAGRLALPQPAAAGRRARLTGDGRIDHSPFPRPDPPGTTIDFTQLQRGLDRQPAAGYAFALAVVAAAIVLRLAIDPIVGRASFARVLMFPAIMVVGWAAGRGPAFAAVALALLGSQFFLLEPRHSFSSPTREGAVASAIFALAGLVCAWFGTAQRHAERAVRESTSARRGSEVQARELLASVPNGTGFVVDAELVVRNAGGELLAGVLAGALPTLLDRPVRDAFVGSAPDEAWYRQAFAGTRVERETEAGGRTLAWRGAPLPDGEGRVASILVTVSDITERRRAREEQRAVERRLRSLANAMPQLVWMADAAGTVVDYNSRVDQYAGLARRGDGAWSWAAVVHPDDEAATTAAWRRSVETGQPFSVETRLRMADGGWRWHLARATRGRDTGDAGDEAAIWFGTSTDVHDLKHTETRLRDAVRQAELAVRLGRIGLLRHDPATGHAELDERMREIWGGAPAALRLDALLERVHPDDVRRVRDGIAGALVQGTPPTSIEYRVRGDDGSERWIRANGICEFAEGKPVVLISTARDITARRLAEQALRRSEERYRAFVANSGEGIWCLEFDPPLDVSLPTERQIDRVYADGRIVECNEAMARMYGLAGAGDLVGRSLAPLLPPGDADARAYLASVIESGYTVRDAESREQGADGVPRWFLNGVRGVVEDGRLLRAWGTQRDITELRRMQSRIGEESPS